MDKPLGYCSVFFVTLWLSIPCEADVSAPNHARLVPNFSIRTRPATEPIDLRLGPQLFIDDFLIAESSNLKKTTHAPKRVSDNPILGWEQSTTQPYVTVLRDPETKRFRLWYNHRIGRDCAIAYAESDDGVTWRTPNLGVLGDDNRLFVISAPFQNGYGVSVIDEGPGFPEKDRRFKVAWWAQEKPWPGGDPGLRVAFSPDGIHWTPWKGNPVLPDFGEKQFLDDPRRPYGVADIIDVFRDPIRRRYAAFFKTPAVPADGYATAPKAGAYIRRLVSAGVSDDFVQWKRPWRVVIPEPRDEGLLEFYSVGGTIARGGLLIGFIRMLRDDLPANPDGPTDGIGYTTLVTSRDGVHWERHDDVFFDRNPDPDAWDHAMTWVGSTLPVGDKLYLYYGGYKRGHKIEPTKERQLGLATMPMDRFVSLDASGDTPGRLRTVLLNVPTGAPPRFTLNADAANGQIRIQLRDNDGVIIPGFTFDDCVPITGDDLALPVTWRSDATLEAQVIRIEFEITNARLFGINLT